MMSSSPSSLSVQKHTIPPAFLCSSSNEVMNDPVLALCGHLFERIIAEGVSNCPVDHMPIKGRELIPFRKLKNEIESWKTHFLEPQVSELPFEVTKTRLQERKEEEKCMEIRGRDSVALQSDRKVRYRSKSPIGTVRFSSTSDRVFHLVNGKKPQLMEVISEIFHRILTPLYGSQVKAIHQIEESSDRTCHLLYEGEHPVGVLVYKNSPIDEFAEFGIRKSIEVKSLFVDNAGKNSGKGLGSTLVQKLKEEVSKIVEPHFGIHVTVSETKQESLAFFRKKGFQIVHEWKGRYIKGITEYLLFCPERIQRATDFKQQNLIEIFARLKRGERNYDGVGFIPQLVHIIDDAHFGDIHGFIKLSDGTFISGSKDNSLIKWNYHGELVKVVDEVEPMEQSPRDWITSLQVVNESYWLSGERNGRVSLWKTNGSFVKDIQLRLPQRGEHVGHNYNAQRVNCFATGLNKSAPSFFAGFATRFTEYNLIEGQVSSTKVHKNDWIYCITPLTEDKLLTVTGCALDVWSRVDRDWYKTETLISEGPYIPSPKGKKKAQRPFISSMAPLNALHTHFALGVFDGSVKVMDIQTKGIIKEWNEHEKRVWSVQTITENLFASSGEDKTIRFYDIRQSDSVHIIRDHVGQVTSMLTLDENILLAGTCSDDPIFGKNGAEIRFYDIRC